MNRNRNIRSRIYDTFGFKAREDAVLLREAASSSCLPHTPRGRRPSRSHISAVLPLLSSLCPSSVPPPDTRPLQTGGQSSSLGVPRPRQKSASDRSSGFFFRDNGRWCQRSPRGSEVPYSSRLVKSLKRNSWSRGEVVDFSLFSHILLVSYHVPQIVNIEESRGDWHPGNTVPQSDLAIIFQDFLRISLDL